MLSEKIQDPRVKREWLAGANCFYLVFDLLDDGAFESQFSIQQSMSSHFRPTKF